MIPLDPQLKAHLENHVTNVCYVWIIKRLDGVELGFTDHDNALEINGVSCEPESGLNASAVESGLGLSGDISEISGALTSDRIRESDIEARIYDGAEVTQWLVNWAAREEKVLLRKYRIGEIAFEDQLFKAELRSVGGNLDQQSGRYFLKHCDADLGDRRCKVETASALYTTDGSVIGNTQNGLQSFRAILGGAFPDGWFIGGTLFWLSGPLAGDRYTLANVEIIDNALRIFTIEAMRKAPVENTAFNLVTGCDKRFSTCKFKFANQLNFRGFPHMPGNENALNYLDRETLLDGGPIVP